MKRLTNKKRWWPALLFAIAVIVAYKLIDNVDVLWNWCGRLIGILRPFIGGFVLAFLLYRPSAALERLFKKCRLRLISRPARVWSIIIVYLALAGLLALAVSVVVPLVVEGVTGLVKAMPGYYAGVTQFVAAHRDGDGLLAAVDVQKVLDDVYSFLRERLTVENIIGYISGIVSVTSSVLSVFISVIISVYMLSGREKLLHTVRRVGEALLPDRVVQGCSHYCTLAADIFSRYVYSMLLDALCVTVLLIPGMYISGIPYPLAFAVFIGVANLIPYFGATISGTISVLVLVLGGHWGMAVFLAVYVIVTQQVDGNLLQPRIFGQSVGIEPIYVLLAITVGGGIGGFIGMLIGVPVVAVIKLLVSDAIAYRERAKQQAAAPKSEESAEE